MNKDNLHIDNLLVKYLIGETSESENVQILNWIELNEENRKYFKEFKWVWDQSKQLEIKEPANVEAAWERLKKRTIEKNESSKSSLLHIYLQPRWIGVAASILVVCFISYFYLQRTHKSDIINLASDGRVLVDTLSDGSIITLNAHSKLTFPEKFDDKSRRIKLEGEAFFDVAPDKNKPFIIHVNDVTVSVVGTSFNIKSRAGKTEVIVETGVVRIKNNLDSIQLSADERTTVAGNQQLSKQLIADRFYNFYRTKVLICNNTPLEDLVSALNEYYNADINIESPSLKKLKLTATFKEQPIDQILTVLEQTFKINAKRNGKTIVLKE